MTAKSMKRHVFVGRVLGMVLAAGLPWAPLAAAPLTQMRAVEVGTDESGAAISLHLSAKVAYRVSTRKNPSRIALVLRHARAASGLVLPQPQGLVTGVTAQPQANGDLRVTIFVDRALPGHFTW